MEAKIGRYTVDSLLARGGMAEVYLARAEGPAGFSKQVVIKRILPEFVEDSRFVRMFLDEAKLAALLNHPNIVQVFDFGEENGTYYIAMEYIEGESLRAVQRHFSKQDQCLKPRLAAYLVSGACEGLHYAHSLCDANGASYNVVHRDISPDNILVSTSGITKVVDFGIAKAAVNHSRTEAGTVKGKYGYLAPEVIRGQGFDRTVDVYALGVTLFELLAGVRPFQADNELLLITRILEGKCPALDSVNLSVPPVLAGIVAKAMAPDRAVRFPDARALQNALEDFLALERPRITASDIAELVRQVATARRAKTTGPPSGPKGIPGFPVSGVSKKPADSQTIVTKQPLEVEEPEPTPVEADLGPSQASREPSSRAAERRQADPPVRRPAPPPPPKGAQAPVRLEDQATTVRPPPPVDRPTAKRLPPPAAMGPEQATDEPLDMEAERLTQVRAPHDPETARPTAALSTTEPADLDLDGEPPKRSRKVIAFVAVGLVVVGLLAIWATRSGDASEVEPKVALQQPAPKVGPPEPKPEPRVDPPSEPKPEPKAEPTPPEPKPEPKVEPQVEPKPPEPKPEPKVAVAPPEPRPEPKPVPKPEPAKPTVAKAKPQKPAPEVASNETGTLTLRSEPWCDVYLDGEKIGVTPLAKHALAAGPHKVSLRNEAMAARRDLVVNVKPNEDVVQAIVFPMGKLAIRVQPWAKVSLNGKPVGTTPMEPLDIAAGRHEVRLENAQLSKDEKHPVVIKEGKQEIIKVIWE